MDDDQRAFFEDIASTTDSVVEDAYKSVAGPPSDGWDPDQHELLATLRRQLDADGLEALAAVVGHSVVGALHSVMVLLNGGTESAETVALTLVKQNGEPLVEGGYAELFMEHLMDTGRLE